MTYEDVLEHFRGVKTKDDDHAEAFCPVHENDGEHHRPSLSLARNGSKTLLKCHANCATDAVVEKVGLTLADLFDGPSAASPSAKSGATSSSPTRRLSNSEVESMARALREDSEAWRHVTEVLRFSPEVVEELRIGLRVTRDRRWLSYPNRDGDGWSFANCRSLDGEKTFVRFPKGPPTHLYRGEALQPNGTAVLLEGERDVAAALTIALATMVGEGAVIVGMPGTGQVRMAAGALASQRCVYVFLDADDAGDTAAKQLVAALGAERCRRVRLERFKDLGDALSAAGPEKARELTLAAVTAAKATPTPTPSPATTGTWTPLVIEGGANASDGDRDPIASLTESSTLPQVKAALEALATKWKLLSRTDRAIERELAVAAVKKVKAVSSAASLVDTFLAGEVRPDPTALSLDDDELAPEPQDTHRLLDDLVAAFEKHAILPRGAAPVLATWAMHTWVLDAAFFTPRIALTSPTKRCGKTLVLELLHATSRRPLLSANVSSAVVYRAIEVMRPTLLIDEADTFLGGNDELRGILNAGFKRDGTVLRCDGDNFEPRAFKCFAPVAIAAIGELPDTIADRSVMIGLSRKTRGEKVVRLDRRAREALTSLRPRLARWARDYLPTLREAQPDVPEGLHDRQRDICEPLLAIGDLAGGEWPTRLREAVIILCAASEKDAADIHVGLIRFGGQFDYAACLSVNCLSNSAGLT